VNLPVQEFPHRNRPRAVEQSATDGKIRGTTLHFRRFSVMPRDRRFLVDGRPVVMGSRAFDLLMVLIEARGAVVGKEEIMGRVWPRMLVDEANLRVQMSLLRKVLGDDGDVIKNIPGRGYLFAADFTTTSAEAGPAASGAGVRREPPKKPQDPLIAVIDDDHATREALGGLMRSAGLRVELFESVQSFLGRRRSTRPECLVLDIMMPGCSGLDFIDDLATQNSRLPVIFISGEADIRMSVRAMKAGAIEFLTKPVHHRELLDAIRSAIEAPPGR
jgi:DNA-binding response OmpR family regulator